MKLVYGLVKDPTVCHKTVVVFRRGGGNEEACSQCSKSIQYERSQLFGRVLQKVFCSADCLSKFDNGFFGKQLTVASADTPVTKPAPIPAPDVPQKKKLDAKEKPATEPNKTEVKTTVKKVCPKCGGAAKRGRGAGTFKHTDNCPVK